MTHQEILSILGFKHIGGYTYFHQEIGAISVEDNSQIAKAIFDNGKRAKTDEIKSILFI